MRILFFLFLYSISEMAVAASSEYSWGGQCSFRNEKIKYEFRSKSGDMTNDDMSLTIDGNVVPVPKALYLKSSSYFKGFNNLCAGGIVAFELGRGFIFATVRDRRPSSSFIVFFYYDAVRKVLIDFLDPELNIKYSSDDDGFPLVFKFENGRYLFRAINEVLHDQRTKEKIMLDDWLELKIKNGKILVENRVR